MEAQAWKGEHAMKKSIAVVVFFLLSAVLGSHASADWLDNIVVHDGVTYKVTNESVDAASIGRMIGKVTSYSDREGAYSGNFSNVFPVGTEYYSIADIATDMAIAVKTDDKAYVKATYSGAYTKRAAFSDYRFWFALAGGVLVLLIIYQFFQKK
jgi:hypothetical protein